MFDATQIDHIMVLLNKTKYRISEMKSLSFKASDICLKAPQI